MGPFSIPFDTLKWRPPRLRPSGGIGRVPGCANKKAPRLDSDFGSGRACRAKVRPGLRRKRKPAQPPTRAANSVQAPVRRSFRSGFDEKITTIVTMVPTAVTRTAVSALKNAGRGPISRSASVSGRTSPTSAWTDDLVRFYPVGHRLLQRPPGG